MRSMMRMSGSKITFCHSTSRGHWWDFVMTVKKKTGIVINELGQKI
jgi:hypothetical protein